MVAVYRYRYLLAIIIIFQTVRGFSVESDRGEWQQVRNVGPLGDDDDANGLGSGMMRTFLNTWNDCVEERTDVSNSTVACQGVRIVRKVIAQLLDGQRSFEISKGLRIVQVEESNAVGRGLMEHEESNLLTRVRRYFQNHELRVRLPDLLPSIEDWTNYLTGVQDETGEKESGRRKKYGKGDGGGLVLIPLMMASMMKVMGLIAILTLAMKAKLVSLVALMLSAIVAVKKLTSKDDDGGHHVSVVPVHHGGDYGHGHRRKREDSAYLLPYRGYYRQ